MTEDEYIDLAFTYDLVRDRGFLRSKLKDLDTFKSDNFTTSQINNLKKDVTSRLKCLESVGV